MKHYGTNTVFRQTIWKIAGLKNSPHPFGQNHDLVQFDLHPFMFSVTHIKDRFVIELLDTAPWYKVDRCMKRKQCLADNVNKAFWKMEHWLIMTEFFSCHNVFQYSYATKA